MENIHNPIYKIILSAIDTGSALTRKQVRALREKSTEAILMGKACFWIFLGIFNVILWVPLPIGQQLSIVLGVICLLLAFIPPVVIMKTHQKRLGFLQESSDQPKKSKASEAGKRYIEAVKAEERPFLIAEVEILESSRELQ